MIADLKPVAALSWDLLVDCPKCGESNNLATGKHDAEFDVSRKIFSNDWRGLKDHEVTCEHCGHKFEIDGVEC